MICPYSIDKNLWGRSCECGVLEDPWQKPPESAYELTAPEVKWPEKSEEILISYKQGLPVALNNQSMPLHLLIASLNEIAGAHGVGRVDHVENRLVGIKSREVYEAPAALTIIKGHQALETLCLTKDTSHFKSLIEQKFSQLVYDGLWFSPLFTAINAFLLETQKYVTGDVKLNLFKGSVSIIGRKSHNSLYLHDLATYDKSDSFEHDAAKGFIKIFGLPLKVNSIVNSKDEELL